MTFVFPDAAVGLAKVLDGAAMGGHTLTTYAHDLMPDYADNLPGVVFSRIGSGGIDGPLATHGVQVTVYALRWEAGAIADALMAWLTEGCRWTPEGLIDAIRPSQMPAVLPFHEDIAQVVFTVLCDTRGDAA